MARFDPRQVVVTLNGVTIDGYADGADVINATQEADAGEWVTGADGYGVFVANSDESGVLTLKLKQHCKSNNHLAKLMKQQRRSLKGFKPFRLEIRDLLNEDLLTAVNGYFTKVPAFVRGQGHNATIWTFKFEKMESTLEEGF